MPVQKAIQFTASTTDFRNLFGKSSQVDKVLMRELRKQIRKAAQEAAKAAQAEVLKPPLHDSPNTASSGLRRDLAAGIKVSVMTGKTAGVAIRSTGRGSLARRYDGQRKKWRHPVFGQDVWVNETGRPYFGSVISSHRNKVTAAVQTAMETAVKSLQ